MRERSTLAGWPVAGRGAAVGLPSVAVFWAYLVAASATGGMAYVLGAPVALLIALAGVRLARRLGLAEPWLVGLGTPVVVASAALLGTLTGGGINDAGGGWREMLGWAIVALLGYPAVAVVSQALPTRRKVAAAGAVAVTYALMIGYIQLSLPDWRSAYYQRHAVPMVVVEVPGFELTSARAYEAELVVWLRGRTGQRYAGSYLRAEVHRGDLGRPACDAPARQVTETRWVCPSRLIVGAGTGTWFRLAEPNGGEVFKEVLGGIAERARMRPTTIAELAALPIATY